MAKKERGIEENSIHGLHTKRWPSRGDFKKIIHLKNSWLSRREEYSREEFTSWPTMRWPKCGDKGKEDNSIHGLPLGGHEGETARK